MGHSKQLEYHNDPEFALTMRILPALAFVPLEVVSFIHCLKTEQGNVELIN